MRILLFLGLVLNTFLVNAQYQLPKVDSKSFVFANGVGDFVDVEFDCTISKAISQLDLDRMVMRSVKDAMLALKRQKKTFIPKLLIIKERSNKSLYHISVKYFYEDKKKMVKEGLHSFEVDFLGNFLNSEKHI